MDYPIIKLDTSIDQIGLCTDIHSNSTDLFHMVTSHSDISHWFCAGDVVDMDHHPNDDRPTIATMRQFNIRSVLGNHDDYVIKNRLHDFQDRADQDYLTTLPFTLKIEMHTGLKIQIFHASPQSLEAVITPDSLSDAGFRKRFGHLTADIVVLGHLHHPFKKRIDGVWYINPGRLTKHQKPGSFCILDYSGKVEWVEIP